MLGIIGVALSLSLKSDQLRYSLLENEDDIVVPEKVSRSDSNEI